MSIVPVKYPLDVTGAAASNLVTDELHVLSAGSVRVLVPTYGAFFTQSVQLYDAATNRLLVMYTDYYPQMLHTTATEQTGQEVHQVLVITDATCGSNVLFNGQMLGGEYSYSWDAIVQLVNRIGLNNSPIDFANIIGKPDAYPPAPHLHDAGDLYGFEYVSAALDQVSQAILLGSAAGQKSIYDYFNGQIAQLQQSIDLISGAHTSAQTIVTALGYTPANKAGDGFTGPTSFQGGTYQVSNDRAWVNTIAATSNTTVLDLSKSNHFHITLSSNTNVSFDVSKVQGIGGNDYIKCTVLIANDATAGRTLSFPGAIYWPNKTLPTWSTAANALNEFEFTTYDGGVTWLAKLVSGNAG